jgi:hypothetical protein
MRIFLAFRFSPSSVGPMTSAAAMTFSSATSDAGRRLPSLASTSWIVRAAATIAIAASLNRRDA